MVRVEHHLRFQDDLNSLSEKDSDLRREIDKIITWFQKNPKDTRLYNHALTGKMSGKWAFSIDEDIRIVYEWIGKSAVRFLAIGRHGKVYKKKLN